MVEDVEDGDGKEDVYAHLQGQYAIKIFNKAIVLA